MSLRLNGSTSGYVELDAPAAAGSNTLVLPDGNGTSGQYLQTDGSGALSWQTVATPTIAFASYAIINDTKPITEDGGIFQSGSWYTRDLNTEVDDPDGIVSITSNQFTLGAGSYLIKWSAPAYRVTNHQTRLYDVTNTAVLQRGSTEYADPTNNVQNRSFGFDRVTITANTTYEIQHRCASSTNSLATGLGVGVGGGGWGEDVVFTLVEIYKEAA